MKMNRLLVSLLCLLVFCAFVPLCIADAVNGVLAEERVVNLPQDSGKWYISVVGDVNDPRYNEVVGWFTTNPNLKKLKDQVHFCRVRTGTAIYNERYASNVEGLPTVRMQKPDGVVVYEAAGESIPMSAAGLNGALAGAVNEAQGIRPILPWRREMERRCPGPCPAPNPDPAPMPDPEPQPIDNGGGLPEVDPVESPVEWAWLSVLCLVGFVGGASACYGRQLYQKLYPPVK